MMTKQTREKLNDLLEKLVEDANYGIDYGDPYEKTLRAIHKLLDKETDKE